MPSPDATPLFIAGAPRSGTSLVRDLVRACSGVYIPPDETQFLPAYFRLAAAGGSPASLAAFLDATAFSTHMRRRGLWMSRPELAELLADPRPAAAIPALMHALAGREGCPAFTFWGDKTPRYTFYLDLFREAFPHMRVLFVIRDPRNTALSMRDAWGRSLVRGAVAWRDAAAVARRYQSAHGPERAAVVRYEELVASPAGTMADVATWLGASFPPGVLETYAGEERWGTARRGPGVVRGDEHRYRAKLRPGEIALIEGIAYRQMQAWGYDPELARGAFEPSTARLAIARLADGVRSLAHYVGERGWSDAVGYKLRQWRTRRMAR